MARFIVGPNDWNFRDAYQQASDGDILELEDNTRVDLGSSVFQINKSLEIVGQMTPTKDLTCYIDGAIAITNQAQVTLRRIIFRAEIDRVMLSVDNASLKLSQVIIYNGYQDAMTKVSIWANDADVTATASIFKAISSDTGSTLKLSHSHLDLTNTSLDKVRLFADTDSDLKLAQIDSFGLVNQNALNLESSHAKLKNCSFKIDDDVTNQDKAATVYVKNTSLETTNSILGNVNGINSLCLVANSSWNSERDLIYRLYAEESRLYLQETSIETVADLEQLTMAYADGIYFKAHTENVINLYLRAKAMIYLKQAFFEEVISPNVRLEDGALATVDQLELADGDASLLELKADATSHIIFAHQATGLKQAEAETRFQTEDKLVGLSEVKASLATILQKARFYQLRRQQGLNAEGVNLNALFMGPKSSGKATSARYFVQQLAQAKLVDEQRFIKVQAKELTDERGYERLGEYLEDARGGVLLIEGAQQLLGQTELLDLLLQGQTPVIILTGSKKELTKLNSVPGFTKHFPNQLNFTGYSQNELVEIGKKLLADWQYRLADEDYYTQTLAHLCQQANFNQASAVADFNHRLREQMSQRVMATADTDLETITNEDIKAVADQLGTNHATKDAYAELNSLIGIVEVKRAVKNFIDLNVINQQRKQAGLAVANTSMHAMFLGNPGTGKTTVARILGELLYQKGLIRKPTLIEVSRSDLVAGYVGQTAIKTRKKLEEALGGVLFIDEAYTLSTGGSNDFGLEAINEILKFMEDHRDDIVIIFAGYTKEMQAFLAMNSGLESRIPNTFTFADYTIAELVQIGLLDLKKRNYQVEQAAYAYVVSESYQKSNDHSNGRWVRNLNDRLVRLQASRLAQSDGPSDLELITRGDLEKLLATNWS